MDNLKAVLTPMFTLFAAYQKAKEDGKIDLNDIALLFPLIPQFGPAMSAAKNAIGEWKSAPQADRAALIAWVADTFDIADDKLEHKIEAGLAVLIEAGSFLA
jgi:hypothetical protein